MQAKYFSDSQLEPMLSEFRIQAPTLKCDKGNPITRMCTNPLCKQPSLVCQDDECEKCGGQKHRQCPNPFKLKWVTKSLQQMIQQQKRFIHEFHKIENSFIDLLYKNRLDLTKKTYLGDLSKEHLSIVQSIYKKNDAKSLTGKQAQAFVDKLKTKKENYGQNQKGLLEYFKQSMDKYFGEILKLKDRLYESFLNRQPPFTIDSNILKTPHSVDLLELKARKEILSDEAIQYAQFLQRALDKPKRLQLLYRGSENGFSAAAFHKTCDNIENTLTIVRTEFGKTIAGFTKYTWNKDGNGTYVHDAGKHAFLLSFDQKEKMVPISDQNLIKNNSGYGPCFGGGSDLYISNKCHHNTNSYASFPTSYNCQDPNKYINNQETYKKFCGATNGRNFRVVEYEVFRVVYQ